MRTRPLPLLSLWQLLLGRPLYVPRRAERYTNRHGARPLALSSLLSSLTRPTPGASGKGMCAYFIDRGTAALYSYLRLSEDGLVEEVRHHIRVLLGAQ